MPDGTEGGTFSPDTRVPPSNIDAERALLASVLLDPTAFAPLARRVSFDDFYLTAHGRVWKAFRFLHDQGKGPDPVLVVTHLIQHETGGFDTEDALRQFLAGLVGGFSTASNASHYADLIVECAMKRALIQRGQSLIDAARNGQSATDLARAYEAAFKNIREDYASERAFRWVSVPDLLKRDRVPKRWLWPHAIASKRVTLFAGDAKAGKTWLLYGMLGALSRGEEWLDFPALAPMKLAIVSEEDEDDIQERMIRFGVVDGEVMGRGSFDMTLRWPDLVDEAGKRAKATGCEGAIFDTFSHLAHLPGDDENLQGPVQAAMRPLLTAAGKYDLAMIPIHHFGRSGGIRGSTVFESAPDQLVLIRHHGEKGSKQRTIEFKGRLSIEAPPELLVEYAQGEPGAHDHYRLVGTPKQARIEGLGEKVLEAMARCDPWPDIDDVRKAASMRKDAALEGIEWLLTHRRITRIGRGISGKPYRYAPVGSVPPEGAG